MEKTSAASSRNHAASSSARVKRTEGDVFESEASAQTIPPTVPQSKARYCVTTLASPSAAYSLWRDYANLPRFMRDLQSVTLRSTDGGRELSHWKLKLKSGATVEWDAILTEDLPNQRISWQSVAGSDISTQGTVQFMPSPSGRGTRIDLAMHYDLPGGKITEMLTKLTGEDPDSLSLINLRRFKALLETGEVASIEGQPNGREEA